MEGGIVLKGAYEAVLMIILRGEKLKKKEEKNVMEEEVGKVGGGQD